MTKSFDRSHKDKKYFIDGTIFNCPFCKRRQVKYKVTGSGSYHDSNTSTIYYYLINCEDCSRVSFHLSKYELKKSKDIHGKANFVYPPEKLEQKFVKDRDVSTLKIIEKKLLDENGKPKELDEVFFYSQPTSFFTIDERIACEIREPLNEAEISLKNNLLTGASGALRKAIYRLLKIENIPETNLQNKFISHDERVDQYSSRSPCNLGLFRF